MLFSRILREYVENYKVALAFAPLMVFTIAFSYFENITFSSGSMFWEYSFGQDFLNMGLLVLVFAVFTWFYSLLISAAILSVRRNLSKIRVEFYLTEMIQKFTMKIFIFYLIFGAVMGLGATTLIVFGYHPLLVNAFLLIISAMFIFVPQAITIEETGLIHAIRENFEFILKNPSQFFLVLFTGAVILFVIGIIEFAFDLLAIEFFAGKFVSLILVLVFAIPFIETLKTYLYMLKFGLIRGFEKMDTESVERQKPTSLSDMG